MYNLWNKNNIAMYTYSIVLYVQHVGYHYHNTNFIPDMLVCTYNNKNICCTLKIIYHITIYGFRVFLGCSEYWVLVIPHPKLLQYGSGMSAFYCPKHSCFVRCGRVVLSFKCLLFDVTLKLAQST